MKLTSAFHCTVFEFVAVAGLTMWCGTVGTGTAAAASKKTSKKNPPRPPTAPPSAPPTEPENKIGTCAELQAVVQEYQNFFSTLVSDAISGTNAGECDSDTLILAGYYTDQSVLFTESDQSDPARLGVYTGIDEIREYFYYQCIDLKRDHCCVTGYRQEPTLVSFTCVIPDDEAESWNTAYGEQSIQGYVGECCIVLYLKERRELFTYQSSSSIVFSVFDFFSFILNTLLLLLLLLLLCFCA